MINRMIKRTTNHPLAYRFSKRATSHIATQSPPLSPPVTIIIVVPLPTALAPLLTTEEAPLTKPSQMPKLMPLLT
jgi:hypothetical protein